MPLFGKKDSGRKSKKDLDKIPIEQKYDLKELLGTSIGIAVGFFIANIFDFI